MRTSNSQRRTALLLGSLLLVQPLAITPRASETNSSPSQPIAPFELADQYETLHRLSFPRPTVMVLMVADHKGSEQIDGWIAQLKPRYGKRIEIEGVADVGKVPPFLRGLVRSKFRKVRPYPVMLDWTGQVAKGLAYEQGQVTLMVISRKGALLLRLSGPSNPTKLNQAFEIIDRALVNEQR